MRRLLSTWSPPFAAAILAGCVLVLGAAYALKHRAQARARVEAQQQLAAVADLKLRQIAGWRKERLDDAGFLAQAEVVADELAQFLATPSDPAVAATIRQWLELLRQDGRYDQAILYDATRRIRMSVPAQVTMRDEDVRPLVESALASGAPQVGDLYLADGAEGPRLNIVVPIRAKPGDPATPLAAVVLRLDPRHQLYPLMQSWPTPSATAETLLVRRDGDQVLFLSELRHRSGTALHFRLPLSRHDLPAARVVGGLAETGEGVDYRGVRVVYVGRSVPGTSWAMVAKVDADELYANLNREAQLAALLGCTGVLALLLAGNLAWQRRNARLLEQLRVQATAMESAANGIVITRPNGVIEWVNPAFTRLTGYDASEVRGNKPNVLRSGQQDRAVYDDLWHTILAGRPWHGEMINRRKDGTLYHEEMTVTPVVDDSGQVSHFVAIKQDVSQRKAIEQEQARMRDELERQVTQRTAELRETVSELEHFSYSITHDLRAPLRAMNTYAVLLEQKFGERLPDEGRMFLGRIQVAATRLDHLIRDCLTYRKTVGGQLPIGRVDLGPLLRDIVNSYPNLQPPAVEIAIEFASAWVEGNESGLTQCFANLLGNAAKFVAAGVQPQIRVTAESRDDGAAGPRVRISIHDNGIGIPEAELPQIFAMFQRLHASHEYPGTGIGLALVRKVVQRMGGTVGVKSTPGLGSVFWVDLRPASHATASDSGG